VPADLLTFDFVKGRVTKSTGSWYSVDLEDGSSIQTRIKGKFRMKGIKSTNPVAVGDFVEVEREENQDTGVIVGIEERFNYIVRKSVNLSKRTHILAANLDQALLVATLNYPKTFTAFIDRFLVTAEAYHIPAVIVFNKIDLLNDEEVQELAHLMSLYEGIGYKVLGTVASKGRGVDAVKELLSGKVTLVSGNSGVGKSTLINRVDPNLNLKTTELSDSFDLGQHTTTFAEMFPLKEGGYIIDTPGIKGFGMFDMDKYEITDYFPEMFELKSECKFNNCLHQDEPKCAIKEAVESGDIAFSRYRSYLSLIAGDEEGSPYREDEFK